LLRTVKAILVICPALPSRVPVVSTGADAAGERKTFNDKRLMGEEVSRSRRRGEYVRGAGACEFSVEMTGKENTFPPLGAGDIDYS
jgi:hypothetical protein